MGTYQSSKFRTWAEHWDGASWHREPTPNVGTGENELDGVAVLGATDVWTVGSSNANSTSTPRTLIEHWNGKQWSVISSPSPGQLSGLASVAAASADNVWAAGAYFNLSGNQQTLVEHWNGKAWSVVASPNPGYFYNSLGALAIVSANDVWAVGASSGHYSSGSAETLVEHWDGKQWQVVSSANVPGALENGLGAVTAVDSRDLWAVGSSESPPNYATKTLVEHWNGSTWQIVPSPNVGNEGNVLTGVAAISAGNIWSVGDEFDVSGLYRTLVEHWNGKRWKTVAGPDPGKSYDRLISIANVDGTLWSAGNEESGNDNDPLVARYCTAAPR